MKVLPILGLLLLLFFAACDQSQSDQALQADTIKYEVVFRESLAGQYLKWESGSNEFGFQYAYTDRGRGPVLNETISLNENGQIVKHEINGVNYLKDSVAESFSVDGKTAAWTNPGGSGTGQLESDNLYLRYDGSPAAFEILARQLTDNTTVELLPEGTAKLVETYQLDIGSGQLVDLLMINGLNMTPTYVWMKDQDLIAKISGNLHIVRSNFSEVRPKLKALQDSIEDQFLKGEATKLAHRINQVVIQDANIFSKEGTLANNQDVFVSGGKITAIVPTGSRDIAAQAKVIEAKGKTLLPGMFDMHTHNNKFRGSMFLAGGITSVRDLANNKQVMALNQQFENDEIIGPRIVTFCGIIDGPGPFANQRNVINTLEEGLAEIQSYKDLGYQQIKLYSSIKPPWVPKLVEKAHELGMRVSGHIPAYMTASQAINHGYNEIQHMNMLFLNFMSDTIDTRTPLRFTMVANHGADLDLNSPEYLQFIDLLKDKDILVDPTVSIFENMFLAQKGEVSPTFEKIVGRLPVISQRSYYSGGLPKPDGKAKVFAAAHAKMLDVVKDLFDKGVDIVPGTDGLPGFLYHRELELYVAAGIPAFEVLKMATIKSAEITGVDDMFGSIEVGKSADLVLVDGNPTVDIRDIRRVEWTMKGSSLFHSKELYESLGIKHYK